MVIEVHTQDSLRDQRNYAPRGIIACLLPPFADVSPVMVGLEACENLFAHLLNRKVFAAEYLRRHSLPIQDVAQSETASNVPWSPGTADPADSLAKQRCDVAPLSPLMRDGAFFPGNLRPSMGVATCEPPQGVRERGGRNRYVVRILHVNSRARSGNPSKAFLPNGLLCGTAEANREIIGGTRGLFGADVR